MRRLIRSIGKAAIAITVAVSMFANVQIGALAAGETGATDWASMAQDNPMAAKLMGKLMEYQELKNSGREKEIKDTVVIDFSKRRKQSYEGPQLGTDELDEIVDMGLDSDAKNVVYINALINYNHFFKTINNGNKESGTGRIVIDEKKNQYIDFTMSNGGGKTTFDAGKSSGTYKVHVTRALLKKLGSADEDVEMAMCGAIFMYDVLGAFDEEYDIEIRFGNSKPGSEETKPEDGKVTPAPVNTDDKKADEASKDDKKSDTAATVAIGTEFSDNGYTYKVTAADEVTFTGLENKALKAVKIADTVSYQGVTFEVTAVADKALSGNKKVTSVTVGANVKTIGASAFAKCKKLKKATINATKLEKIGKKAFNKNSKKLVVKIHKSNFKAYKKLFKKAKLSSVKLKKVK